MEERQVTVDGVTHPLPQPLVLATQNPIEYEGTFLPEQCLTASRQPGVSSCDKWK